MYVQLGRGQDYAWSATTSGQDIIDTYAVELCHRTAATKDPTTCTAAPALPMEKLERKNAWKPTVADGTAAGSYRMQVWRTKYGPVTHRATVGGKTRRLHHAALDLPARGRLDHRLPDAQRPAAT